MLHWLVEGNGVGHIILYAGTMLKLMNSVTPTLTAKLIVHVFLKKTLIQSRNANLETLRVTKQHLAGNQFKIRQ
jgi:hypothetical protein